VFRIRPLRTRQTPPVITAARSATRTTTIPGDTLAYSARLRRRIPD
jgi:hypothetical protein